MNEIENLETFYLIYLGNSLTNEIQEQLRIIINYLVLFEDEEQCLKYIHSLSKNDRIILIINNEKLNEEFVHLRKIISIYIYSNEKKINEQCTKNFKKIKGITNRWDELIQQIKSDQSYQLDEIFSYNIFNPKKFVSTNLNNHCIHSQMLIDCLMHMKPISNDKNELITLCKEQYQNNSYELNIIEEFERDYVPERSIWWYMRHSFIYRLLNKALRREDVDLLLHFRFFINDIKQQIEKTKCSSSIHVYRAQLMSKKELEFLTKFIGNFISINTFLLTNSNREQIRSLLSSSILSDDIEKVFFQINAHPRSDKTKPFSKITSNKEQILFMIGTIFRLVHIDRDIDGIWNIQLSLCSNKEHQLQTIIQMKKSQLDIVDENILSFGFILEDMEKYNDAEKYYYYLLNQLPEDHQDITRCYHALGEINQKKNNYNSSLEWFNKSIEIDLQSSNIDYANIATSYNSIAVVYSKKGDYTLALESYGKALEIWKKIFDEDHEDIAMCYNNIGIIYQEEKNYSQALEYYHKAWNIRQKTLSTEHPSLGQSNVCIGNVHYALNHYDLALEHYNLSLEIFKKILSSHHLDIAMVLRNIGLSYQGKGEFQQALLYMKKALTIYRYSLPEIHPDIIQLEQIIRQIS